MGGGALTIWTIGHSTRPLAEFISVLAAHGIQALADVRRFPGSRKHPHFSAESLRQSLPEAGIEYVPMPELGGRRPARPGSRNTAWRNGSFRGYADYMEAPEFRAGTDRLLDLARRRRTAIMCAEAVWWRCHRALIADHLKSRGLRVLHIRDAARSQEHPYTSAAHIDNGTLSYAAEEEEAPMSKGFKVGDHVSWNSEAGRVRGTIIRVHTRDVDYKGYTHHASKDEPQYEIKSDKTDHVAMHKGPALRKIAKPRTR
ncbi:MAG: HVA1 family protein [Phycisphaerales bacterium]|nr:HVA1 family protein [Phycisphaerales bacterium]